MTAPLPIDAELDAIAAALAPGATVVLQAPPGAGKTTRVPLRLLKEHGDGERILMLEPRRLAARAAAQRMAASLEERVGERIGYSVRLESRCSAATRVEVLTAGLFLRRLQADPGLEGVGCVIFDEFHERAAEADLALALLRQARSLLRPDLRLLLMSATPDLEALAPLLDQAVLIRCPGRSYPVQVLHQQPRERERLEEQVLRGLEAHWLPERQSGATALVFLPGQREIAAAETAIRASRWGERQEVVALHGQLPLEAQSRAIAASASPNGKVVLATSIAESSLTLEGVRLVIDAGLSRRNRYDPASGLDQLVTVPASLASAEQRRGRAGRLGPGRCLRLWSPGSEQRRPAFDTPELLECDPLPIVLQLAEWGAGLGDELAWIDPPPRASLEEGQHLLRQLGALDGAGQLTSEGRAMARLGVSPRLALLLLRARSWGQERLGCELAVLLGERDPLAGLGHGSDLLARLDWLRARPGEPADQVAAGRSGQRRELQRLASELSRQLRALPAAAGDVATHPPRSGAGGTEAEAALAAQLLACAYPDRLALARSRGEGRFLMRHGRGAVLNAGDPLAGAEALVIARADGQGADARVLLALSIDRATLDGMAEAEGSARLEARWDPQGERVRCERQLRLGALVLSSTPWPEAEEADVLKAMQEGLRQMGLAALPWCGRSRSLQQRLTMAHHWLGEPWPDRSLERLEADPAAWLEERLMGLRSRQDLRELDLIEALWGELDWERRQRLDQLLPEGIRVPSGRRVELDYSGSEPVLAVKLQEMFGAREHPTLLEGRLPISVHLLSPAGRPAAITRDLAGFWSSGYSAVRRELRGRYPRHPWPEDPGLAEPTALTKAGLRRAADRQAIEAVRPGQAGGGR